LGVEVFWAADKIPYRSVISFSRIFDGSIRFLV